MVTLLVNKMFDVVTIRATERCYRINIAHTRVLDTFCRLTFARNGSGGSPNKLGSILYLKQDAQLINLASGLRLEEHCMHDLCA